MQRSPQIGFCVSGRQGWSGHLRPSLAPVRSTRRRCTAPVKAVAEPEVAGKTFANYAVYKGKAALSFAVSPPTWLSKNNSFTVDKEGRVLLTFANVAQSEGAQQGYGNRNYDWGNKIVFSLSVTELAALADFDASGPHDDKGLEMYHDPKKGQQGEGLQTKRLIIKHGNAGAVMMSLSQTANGVKSFVTVPLSRPEFLVIKTLSNYMIPHMLGFDMVLKP